MKNRMANIVSFLLIILWIYAAVSKLSDIPLFASQLRRQPLPGWSVAMLLWLLPYTELIVAALLCFEKSRVYGLLFSFLLLVAFTVYTGLTLSGAYGHIPCACGGVFSFMQWKGHLIFNSIAAILSFFSWYAYRKPNTITVINRRKYYAHKGE